LSSVGEGFVFKNMIKGRRKYLHVLQKNTLRKIVLKNILFSSKFYHLKTDNHVSSDIYFKKALLQKNNLYKIFE